MSKITFTKQCDCVMAPAESPHLSAKALEYPGPKDDFAGCSIKMIFTLSPMACTRCHKPWAVAVEVG
jgi:hypothetical protein